jgi:hypothetical protein
MFDTLITKAIELGLRWSPRGLLFFFVVLIIAIGFLGYQLGALISRGLTYIF